MKLWQGRTDGGTDAHLDELNNSLRFDRRLYREDITGSIAHAAMLGACGIISPADAEAIRGGLEDILGELDGGTLDFDPAAEDIHSFVEAELTRRVGDAGKRLHTARSRNDQVATDLKLYTKNVLKSLQTRLEALIGVLDERRKEHFSTIMPGYTHLQRAQPVTLNLHLGAWREMLARDWSRLDDALDRMGGCPLGAGALAGTTYPIDRDMTAEALGFAHPCANPMDAVSDRDFVLDTLSALSILMVHLSRMSEEVILWCSSEFAFASLPDGFATGSSIMPQKRNPDLCELIRGKTGRVFGSLICLLTTLKGLPLCYNKDMQEDKEALFDALDTAELCLAAFTPMMTRICFHPERMRAAAAKGFLNATDCADYLVGKGLPFREAYGIVGRLVERCQNEGETLETLPIARYKEFSALFAEDVYAAVDLDHCVKRRGIC